MVLYIHTFEKFPAYDLILFFNGFQYIYAKIQIMAARGLKKKKQNFHPVNFKGKEVLFNIEITQHRVFRVMLVVREVSKDSLRGRKRIMRQNREIKVSYEILQTECSLEEK